MNTEVSDTANTGIKYCLLSNPHIEALTPSVTVFGNTALRKYLMLNEVIRLGT